MHLNTRSIKMSCLGLVSAVLLVCSVSGCSEDSPTGGDPAIKADAQNPIILVSKLEGKTLTIGSTINIQWDVYPELVTNGVIVELSVNDGADWAQIQNVNGNPTETLPVGTTSMGWTIPSEITAGPDQTVMSTVSNQCHIRISEYESDHMVQTSAPFSITQ